jgi:hypothetical protein
MRKPALVAVAGAFALAGCNVNVSSNDAATQNAIEDVQQGASDFVNGAGNLAADAGNELGEAARDAGNTLERVGDAAGNEVGGNKSK